MPRVAISRQRLAISLFGIFAILLSFSRSQAQENELIIGGEALGTLAGGEARAWTFAGQRGQVISLSAETYPPLPRSELDLSLELYGPDGALLDSDADSSVGRDAIILYIPLLADGDYQVIVRNETTWVGGDFRLTVAESTLPEGCQTPFGQRVVAQMPSAILGYEMRYRVLLPPCAEVWNRPLPYVILGHGSASSDEHWEQLGIDEALVRGVALNRLPLMAIALPWGGELANTNTFQPGASWEYVLLDEFIPHLESNYCLQTERAGRAIGGISRGGFWAFLTAFRHPDMFVSLGGHSPFFDLYHAPASHNPLDLILGPAPNPPLRIWMDRGKDDYAQVNIDLAHERLTQNGLGHEWQLYPVGEHENAYWQAHLEDYLQFYAGGFYGEDWQTELAAGPPCERPLLFEP
jgi:enterochelin esterase-like enzyme